MTALGRNHRWREAFVADRTINSLKLMNGIKDHQSTQPSRQDSAEVSLSQSKGTKSSMKHFLIAPVVLTRYRNFKLSTDSIRSRTLKIKSKQKTDDIKLSTQRRQKMNHLKELISEYTSKNRSKQKQRSRGKNNPEGGSQRIINSKFIIRNKSNILSSFQKKDDTFLLGMNESRIENIPEDNGDNLGESRNRWARIIKCLDFD